MVIKCVKFVDKEGYVHICGYLEDLIIKFNVLKLKILVRITVICKCMYSSQNSSINAPNLWISIVRLALAPNRVNHLFSTAKCNVS